jgi:hypothetical protein
MLLTRGLSALSSTSLAALSRTQPTASHPPLKTSPLAYLVSKLRLKLAAATALSITIKSFAVDPRNIAHVAFPKLACLPSPLGAHRPSSVIGLSLCHDVQCFNDLEMLRAMRKSW